MKNVQGLIHTKRSCLWSRSRKRMGSLHFTSSCLLQTNTSTENSSLQVALVTARKRSLRRLCFYTCLSFCPQGGLPQCMLGYPPPPRAEPPGPGTNLPSQCMLGDMVNKRAVCILLECNLVVTKLILY